MACRGGFLAIVLPGTEGIVVQQGALATLHRGVVLECACGQRLLGQPLRRHHQIDLLGVIVITARDTQFVEGLPLGLGRGRKLNTDFFQFPGLHRQLLAIHLGGQHVRGGGTVEDQLRVGNVGGVAFAAGLGAKASNV